MRRRRTLSSLNAALLGTCGLLSTASAEAQNTIFFSTADPGQTKSVAEWGVDTAWPSFDNVRQSVHHIGAGNVDVVRLTFHPGQPLTDNGNGTYSLSATAKGYIDAQLSLSTMAGFKPLTMLPGEFAAPFDATHWLRTIKATQEYINSKPGFTTTQIKAIEVFNEPDFWAGQGTPAQLNTLITQLKSYPVFQNTEFLAGSTLNSNNARGWYDPVPAATHGSSHLLGGSMTSYVNFMEYVKGTGKPFVNPELHSLGEAIVGAEHGMVSGTWWGDVLRARGLFVQASDGKRLGYAEDLGRQSAAAVYRAPNGKIYAFAGGLERFGQSTAHRFVSTDRDVYFNGIPVREYMLQTKFDETNAANPPGNDFENYGSWSNQGAFADVDTSPGVPGLDGYRWKIVNTQTGQVMEVAGGGTGDGASIRTAADGGATNQKWDIVRTRNGYVHLFNANSGRTAEIANGSLSDNAAVRQWGTADNQIQQWYVEDAGNGSFYIRNAYSNKFLSASTTGNAFQFDNTGSNLQKWRFVLSPINSPAKAHYSFQGNASSSTGTFNGVASGNPTYGNGPTGQGQAINLDGADDYVTLPSGVATSANITISTYVKWDGGNAWQRIFDFGNATQSYMFLTPRSGDNTMRFAVTTTGNGGEQILDTSPLPIGQWVHLALTLGGNTGALFVDGKPRVAGQILLNPDHVNPALNYIGRSQFGADPMLDGMVDDFRVFDYALHPSQVASFVFQRWTGEANASWTTAVQASPKNWQRNVAAADYANGTAVLFDDFATSCTVNLTDASVSPASVQFDNARNDYVLNGPGAIAGGASLTKNGVGVLTINNANSYTGGTTVNGGTLVAGHANAIGAGGSLAINAGATLRSQAGGSTALDVGALSVAPTGKLDLNDGGLVKRNGGSGAAGRAATLAITAALKSGLENGGNFDWLGNGISSTEANADNAAAGSVLYGLGVIQNNLASAGVSDGTTTDATPGNEIYATFKGRTVALNDTLVRYTYMGDADLSGLVDSTDYSLIDSGFALALSGWLNGDFDYSGSIDATDYALIDNAFAFQAGPLSAEFLAMYDQHVATFGQSYVQALAAVQAGVVPEPASLGILGGVTAVLGIRRSRRRAPVRRAERQSRT